MRILSFLFVLILTFFIVAFVMNKSIISYLEQKYHLQFVLENELLNEAHSFKIKLEQIKNVLSNDTQALYYGSLAQIVQDENIHIAEPEFSEDENITKFNEALQNSFIKPEKILVKKGEEFLLIGDSLMQGVALALIRDFNRFDIKSTNLSKQSSGLSYKNYFNWAKATENAFLQNDKFKYLVVLLGANDPWDIKYQGKYQSFNSQLWREIYKTRVNELIQIAKTYNAEVLWYEIPPVKKESLNEKIEILNAIYEEQNLLNDTIFIKTQKTFSLNGHYSSYIKDENNKSIKVRADDGVHFNIKGAKIMSELLFEKLDTSELDEK